MVMCSTGILLRTGPGYLLWTYVKQTGSSNRAQKPTGVPTPSLLAQAVAGQTAAKKIPPVTAFSDGYTYAAGSHHLAHAGGNCRWRVCGLRERGLLLAFLSTARPLGDCREPGPSQLGSMGPTAHLGHGESWRAVAERNMPRRTLCHLCSNVCCSRCHTCVTLCQAKLMRKLTVIEQHLKR